MSYKNKTNSFEWVFKGLEKEEVCFVREEDGKLDIELLEKIFESLLQDARKCNRLKSNYHAGRRFRLNTTSLGKAFTFMRRLTPVKKRKYEPAE